MPYKNWREAYDRCRLDPVCVEKVRARGRRQSRKVGAKPSRERARVKYLYGLTPEGLKDMNTAQGGLCAICGADEKLHIDHDHATGQVRGLLCKRCNSGLGMFTDDKGKLSAAIGYLTRSGG